MKSLKPALNEGKVPEVVHKYCISLPTEEAHHQCHPTKGALGLSQRIHPELIAKIQEFVSAGTHEPVEIQRLLKHHVHYYMCAGNLPNPTDRAYYPLLDDIKIMSADQSVLCNFLFLIRRMPRRKLSNGKNFLLPPDTTSALIERTMRKPQSVSQRVILKKPFHGFIRSHGSNS